MVTYKFLVDYQRCIRCTGCEAACKTQNNVPGRIRRIRVVTVNEGKEGEINVPMKCFHCADAPCIKTCPVNALYNRADGIVLHDKDRCIGCGYCLYTCPFGVPQFLASGIFGSKGKMDKCSFCVQPFNQKDGQGNMIFREAKPKCAGFCATKSLLAGDAQAISAERRKRTAGKIGYQ